MEHITKNTIDGRIHLIAKNGYVVTDGANSTGYHLILALNRNESEFYAITEEEYKEIVAEEAQKMLADMP